MNPVPPYRFDDEKWKNILEASASGHSTPAQNLPGFPPDELQTKWVGRSGAETIKEVWPFYRLAKSNIDFGQGPILDFGIGWGRIARLFLNDLPMSQIYGVDTSDYILQECRKLGFGGGLARIDEFGRLPFPNGFFSGVTAYSVFTHLSQHSADHWIKEIQRVLNPQGRLVATVLTTHFLQLGLEGAEEGAPHWMKTLSGRLGDPAAAKKSYDRGEHVWHSDPSHNHPDYGWAAIPVSYIEKEWKKPVEFIDNLGFHQGAFVI